MFNGLLSVTTYAFFLISSTILPSGILSSLSREGSLTDESPSVRAPLSPKSYSLPSIVIFPVAISPLGSR